MNYRSHIDPTTFVIYMHVNADRQEEEFLEIFQKTQARRGENIAPLMDSLNERLKRTQAHERYHFWQGLRLPFLYYYACVTYRQSLVGTIDFAKVDPDWKRWPLVPHYASPGFNRLDQQFTVSADTFGLLKFGAIPDESLDFNVCYSSKDMLEAATTIFDFQINCSVVSEMSDPVKFRRWAKRNPANLDLFDFISKYFSSEKLALRILIPLINASFQTSLPERTFVELAARVWGKFCQGGDFSEEFLSQPEPCRWPELFHSILSDLEYDYPFGEFPQPIDLGSVEYFYMDPKVFLEIKFGKNGAMLHPFLGPLAIEWERLSHKNHCLKSTLNFPGYASGYEDYEDAIEFLQAAVPQLRVVRVNTKNGGNRVYAIGECLIGNAFRDGRLSDLSSSEYRGYILDVLASYGAFRRATGFNMSDASRTCHHTGCPHFEDNFCNSYPIIPERYEDCGFPSRLQNYIFAIRR